MKKPENNWADTVQWVGIVAGCIIGKDKRYLMVQEKQAKVHGLWNIPAGYVDKGEDIQVAAIREAKEETGFDVSLGAQIGIYHEDNKRPVKHVFKANIVGGGLKIPEDEVLDAKWLNLIEIKQLDKEGKLRASWIIDAITKVERLA